MAVLTTIGVVLGVWCAASVATAALYVLLRGLHVHRLRAEAARPGRVAQQGRAAPGCAPGRRAARLRPSVRPFAGSDVTSR